MKRVFLFAAALLLCWGCFAKTNLDGKKVVFIGNSFIYYGGCVVNGNQRQTDEGMFYQLCKQHGERVEVYDCTYGGHRLADFTERGCQSAKLHTKGEKGHCKGLGMQLLQDVPLEDMDVVFMSEAGENNKNIIADIKNLKARFTNPKTKFYYMVHSYTYYKHHAHILDNLAQMKAMGITIVPWGEVAYTLTMVLGKNSYKGNTYSPQTFIKNNGDNYHPNPLAGYVAAQMCYSAVTGRKAKGEDYAFVEQVMPTGAYVEKHYKSAEDTNYPALLQNKKAMKNMQTLMDKLLKKAN